MLKVGTIVSVISASEPFKGIVVPAVGYDKWGLVGASMVLITSSGEFQGSTYPFQYHQLEIISESS